MSRPNPLGKWLSITGLFPLVVFVAEHLAFNTIALMGPGRFERAIAWTHRGPISLVIELLLILAPLAFHAILGLIVALRGESIRESSNLPDAIRKLNRAAAIGAFLFIVYHLVTVRFANGLGAVDGAGVHDLLARSLSSTWKGIPIRGIGYMLGVLAVSVHLAFSIFERIMNSGVGEKIRSTARVRFIAVACAILGSATFLAGANVVVYFATGSRLVGPSEKPLELTPAVVCPAQEH